MNNEKANSLVQDKDIHDWALLASPVLSPILTSKIQASHTKLLTVTNTPACVIPLRHCPVLLPAF
jgi:hypothetical protein